MNIVEFISNWWKEALEYKERVLKDGGTTKREDNVQRYYQMCKEQGILNSIKFAWLGEAGGKFRTSGANQFWTKAYSLVTPQAKYGPELVVNGDFSNGTTGWTGISGTSYVEDSKFKYLNAPAYKATTQVGILTVGKLYKLTLTVSDYVSGSLYAVFGNQDVLPVITANGTYTRYAYCVNSTNFSVLSSSLSVNTFNIDNISVVEVLNSIDGSPTDATQSTANSQPYISGNIAPNEKPCLKNNNGDSRYMTHPTISFAANEAWSVTTVVNWDYRNDAVAFATGGTNSKLRIQAANSSNKDYSITNESNSTRLFAANTSINNIGKTRIVNFIADGLGNLSLFVDGAFVQKLSSVSTNIALSSFLCPDAARSFYGKISAHIIRAQALTTSQVAAEANFLRSLYPEIPSVTIGTQTWATSNCEMVGTPQSNLIQNVTLNANEEKITNAADREFSSDTGFWTKEAGWTISGGYANCSGSNRIFRASTATIGKWYKVSYTILNYTSGNLIVSLGAGATGQGVGPIRTSNGTFTDYILCNGSNGTFIICNTGVAFNGSIDNVSVQEVGWSDATNLYDYVYANTAGTVEEKTYAAVKAAAMWCYYNNDAALGAIYGKLYNWYAVKLLQMDIDYYNAANPSTPWGWGIPTETEWNTLETTINNDAEVLKHAGTTYWSAPNAGTNSSGFTALPAGYRKEDGTFAGLNTTALFGSTDMSVPRIGKSLRLIKR